MAMTYEDGAVIDPRDFRALRDAVNWTTPSVPDDDLRATLSRTWNVIARDAAGTVIGFGRLLDDGLLHATIWDIVVRPDMQRIGVGDTILQRLLARASERDIIALVATPSGRQLYEQHGFCAEARGQAALFRPRQT